MTGAGPGRQSEHGGEFVFPATASACAEVHAQVLEITTSAGFKDEAQLELDLALQEALANALIHGCKKDASKSIHCSVRMDDGAVVITIADPGTGFDPDAVPDPLSEVGQGRFSGRGVHFMRSVMDEVSYARNGAVLTMRKRLR